MTTYPKPSTPSMVSWMQMKIPTWYLCLVYPHVAPCSNSIIKVSTPSLSLDHHASPCLVPIIIATHILMHMISTQALSLITNTKHRAFNLPLVGNWWQPFHKDVMIKFGFELISHCPNMLPCVRTMDKWSWIQVDSNGSPYMYAICLDSGSIHV
jgi:hypothetical protein